jgi:hypothetical protein
MLRDRGIATATLFAGDVTALGAAATLSGFGAVAPSGSELAAVLGVCSALAGGIYTYIVGVAPTKLSERQNAELARKNHVVRAGMAKALLNALIEIQGDPSLTSVSVFLSSYLDIWINQIKLALSPKTDITVLNGLFPMQISDAQFQALSHCEVDETRLSVLSEELLQNYRSTLERDVEALADLLTDRLALPPANSPPAYLRLWNVINASAEALSIVGNKNWRREEALSFSRKLLPLYRRCFAQVFASGGPESLAIGLRGHVLDSQKLDHVLIQLNSLHQEVSRIEGGLSELDKQIGHGFSDLRQMLGGPQTTPRIKDNFIFHLSPLHPVPKGRGKEIEDLTDQWLADRKHPLLIYGPPGIGKSTIARAILRAPKTESRFGCRRYEFRCDIVSTLSDLINQLSECWFGVADPDLRRARAGLRMRLTEAPALSFLTILNR